MNYWLFQGNPKIYRVKDALKDEAIRSWKVSAHKGKIQSGDQVILWMTGREAGCYALAEVVSAVYFREDDEVEKLYYADNYADDAAGDAVEIKLLHNFWNRPVLWEKIRDLPEFNGFPAGRQGTNFQANKIQFEMIFELGKQNIQRSFFKYYPGEKAKHWQQDLATGEARIGYSELETGSMEQYATLGDLNMHLGLSPTNKSNKTWNLFLLKSAREGDVVFAAGGQSLVLGIGIIKDSYRYDGNNEYAHIRPVEWLTTDPWAYTPNFFPGHLRLFRTDTFSPTLVGPQIIAQYLKAYPQHRELFRKHGIFFDLNEILLPANMLPFHSLNTILYGPPGTGKTYRLGQIQADFTDQSSVQSQEDFRREIVVGLSWWEILALCLHEKGRAKVPELLRHPLVESKFATSDIEHHSQRVWSVLQMRTVTDCPNVNLNEARRHGIPLFYKEVDSVWRFADGISLENDLPDLLLTAKRLQAGPANREARKRFQFSTCHQSLAYEDFIEGLKPVLSDEYLDDQELGYKNQKGVFYLACEEAAVLAGWKNLADCLADSRENRQRRFAEIADKSDKRYCLMLDEINRANVSAVFGELITLLEKDKRLGADNELIISKMPYSQNPFGVPANLYVIGTMNTADRSVEALDTALRRRFAFVEMIPKPEMLAEIDIPGLDLVQLLITLNHRIERLLDRDHCIGHAYLLQVRSIDDLKEAFQNSIIPLLQEYFYGDYRKIGAVLGENFMEEVKVNETKWPKNFRPEEDEQRVVYRLKDMQEYDVEEFASIYE